METRYVGAFAVLFWLALYSGISVPDQVRPRRLMAAVVVALTAVFLVAAGLATARELSRTKESSAEDLSALQNWKVAEGLLRGCTSWACSRGTRWP